MGEEPEADGSRESASDDDVDSPDSTSEATTDAESTASGDGGTVPDESAPDEATPDETPDDESEEESPYAAFDRTVEPRALDDSTATDDEELAESDDSAADAADDESLAKAAESDGPGEDAADGSSSTADTPEAETATPTPGGEGTEPHPESESPVPDPGETTGGTAVDRPPAQPTEPTDDEEMPLTAHIEEMVRRLAVVMVVMAAVTAVVFPFAEFAIDVIWYSLLPDPADPRLYGPLELKLTELKVASLAGFIIALPVFVYETYQFMRPGLYPNERRYYLASVPTSLVLAVVGVGFAYFLILPAIFEYFYRYSKEAANIAFGLRQTFDLILLLMGYLALVFQIPLLVMLAIMMGLTTRQWLADRRLYFWGGFFGISFLFSPDPTGMAPILVTATMIGLFEGTLALLKWTGR